MKKKIFRMLIAAMCICALCMGFQSVSAVAGVVSDNKLTARVAMNSMESSFDRYNSANSTWTPDSGVNVTLPSSGIELIKTAENRDAYKFTSTTSAVKITAPTGGFGLTNPNEVSFSLWTRNLQKNFESMFMLTDYVNKRTSDFMMICTRYAPLKEVGGELVYDSGAGVRKFLALDPNNASMGTNITINAIRAKLCQDTKMNLVTVTYSKTNGVKFYIDGELAAHYLYSHEVVKKTVDYMVDGLKTDGAMISLRHEAYNPGNYATNVVMGDFRIYDKELTFSEIQNFQEVDPQLQYKKALAGRVELCDVADIRYETHDNTNRTWSAEKNIAITTIDGDAIASDDRGTVPSCKFTSNTSAVKITAPTGGFGLTNPNEVSFSLWTRNLQKDFESMFMLTDYVNKRTSDFMMICTRYAPLKEVGGELVYDSGEGVRKFLALNPNNTNMGANIGLPAIRAKLCQDTKMNFVTVTYSKSNGVKFYIDGELAAHYLYSHAIVKKTVDYMVDGLKTDGAMISLRHEVYNPRNYATNVVMGDFRIYDKELKQIEIMNSMDMKKINFDTKGAAVLASMTGLEGESITTLPMPMREAFEFKGWYKEAELVNKFTDKAYGDTNITLYASWEQIDPTYSVTYELDGGVNSELNPDVYPQTDSVTLENPTKTGYKFCGWYTESAFTNRVTNVSGANSILYAKFSYIKPADKFVGKVSMDALNNSYQTYDKEQNSWVTDSSYSVAVDSLNTSVVSTDRGNAYKFTSKTSAVKITAPKGGFGLTNADEVSFSLWTRNLTQNYESILMLTDYTNGVTSDLMMAATRYSALNNGDYDMAGSARVLFNLNDASENIGLASVRAKLCQDTKMNLVTVTYSKTNGIKFYIDGELAAHYLYSNAIVKKSVDNMVNGVKTDGAVLSLRHEVFNKANYATNVIMNDFRIYDKELSKTDIADIMGVSKIVFDTNGGNSIDDISGLPNENFAMPADPVKDGSIFRGWHKDTALTQIYDNTEVFGETSFSLYAKWEKLSYKITYNLNGGSHSDNPSSYTMSEDDIIVINSANKAGYTFDGWYRYADFTGEISRILPQSYGDLELFAKFDAINYNIDYVLNGGTNNTLNIERYQALDTVTLADAVKDGFIFGGWYSDAEFTTKVTEVSGQSTTLYAKWIEIEKEVETINKGGCGTIIGFGANNMVMLISIILIAVVVVLLLTRRGKRI